MSYLLLDTRARDTAFVYWWQNGEMFSWLEGGQVSDVLRLIQKYRSVLSESLEGVAVVAGPGRFSAIRVGVLTANLLARWYHVPLFAVSCEEAATESGRQELFQEIANHCRTESAYVSPLYDREPNITTPRV